MSTQAKRVMFSVALVTIGLLFVVTDLPVSVNFLPLPIAGYLLIPLGVAGLLGVNIFWGGPWDKRLDSQETILSPQGKAELEDTVLRQGEQVQRVLVWLWRIPFVIVGVVVVLVLFDVI